MKKNEKSYNWRLMETCKTILQAWLNGEKGVRGRRGNALMRIKDNFRYMWE